MTEEGTDRFSVVLARGQSRVFALPLPYVIETMRPLPTEPVAEMPSFVRGLAVVRGTPVPVVDLNLLLGGTRSEGVTRFVTLRTGHRLVALAVEQVIGVRQLAAASLDNMPPLLLNAQPDLITAIGALDQQLLLVLQTGRILPDDVWQSLEAHGATV